MSLPCWSGHTTVTNAHYWSAGHHPHLLTSSLLHCGWRAWNYIPQNPLLEFVNEKHLPSCGKHQRWELHSETSAGRETPGKFLKRSGEPVAPSTGLQNKTVDFWRIAAASWQALENPYCLWHFRPRYSVVASLIRPAVFLAAGEAFITVLNRVAFLSLTQPRQIQLSWSLGKNKHVTASVRQLQQNNIKEMPLAKHTRRHQSARCLGWRWGGRWLLRCLQASWETHLGSWWWQFVYLGRGPGRLIQSYPCDTTAPYLSLSQTMWIEPLSSAWFLFSATIIIHNFPMRYAVALPLNTMFRSQGGLSRVGLTGRT